jgi:hypothetical protein
MQDQRAAPPGAKKKSSEWIGAVVLLGVIIGGVLVWRWLGGASHGEDCTDAGTCSFGHMCIDNPNGLGSVCAATCESDAGCEGTRCVPVQGYNSLTGTETATVIGADHVCAL